MDLKEESQNPNIVFVYLDLCDFKSVEVAAERILNEVPHLDVLVNCAGVGYIGSRTLTKDGMEVM